MSRKSRLHMLALLFLALVALACSMSGTGSELDQEALREMLSELTQSAPSATPKVPRTVRLAPDGSGDYPGLAAAIADLAPGSTILLDEGNYDLPETLTINKTLTLQGAGMDATKLRSSDPGGVLNFTGPGNIVLQGITFRYNGSEFAHTAMITDAGFEISDCRFSGAVRDMEQEKGGIGLYIFGTSNGSITNSRIESNQLHGLAAKGEINIFLEYSTFDNNLQTGMIFWGQTVGTVQACSAGFNGKNGFAAVDESQVTFVANNAHDNGQAGITTFGNAVASLSLNEVFRNDLSGIMINESSIVTATDNIARDNVEAGFRASDDSELNATNNQAFNNGLSGFIIRSSAIGNLQGNTIDNNGQSAISFFQNAAGTVSGNTCSGNVNGGITINDSAAPTIGDNNCQP